MRRAFNSDSVNLEIYCLILSKMLISPNSFEDTRRDRLGACILIGECVRVYVTPVLFVVRKYLNADTHQAKKESKRK